MHVYSTVLILCRYTLDIKLESNSRKLYIASTEFCYVYIDLHPGLALYIPGLSVLLKSIGNPGHTTARVMITIMHTCNIIYNNMLQHQIPMTL